MQGFADTALHGAAFFNQPEVIKALLTAKADVHAKNKVHGCNGAGMSAGRRRGVSTLLVWLGS